MHFIANHLPVGAPPSSGGGRILSPCIHHHVLNLAHVFACHVLPHVHR